MQTLVLVPVLAVELRRKCGAAVKVRALEERLAKHDLRSPQSAVLGLPVNKGERDMLRKALPCP